MREGKRGSEGRDSVDLPRMSTAFWIPRIVRNGADPTGMRIPHRTAHCENGHDFVNLVKTAGKATSHMCVYAHVDRQTNKVASI